MGAACSTIDVSPELAKTLAGGGRRYILQDGQFETVWRCLGPYIHGAVERGKMRRLLRTYLEKTPCTDRVLVLNVSGQRWVFEILSNRRGPEYTEIVLSENPVRAARA